ncbi:MAG: hypothetical protein AAGA60_23305 [Cyanobacteria bacterium P01_E01_bin.42]
MAVQRWTDKMLDELASRVNELTSSVSEVKESISEVKDSIDGLRITAQALLQVAAQQQRDTELMKEEIELGKQRQAESDERFNVLLEEIRYLIRRNDGE